jgi:prefoldin subunit 5
MANLNLTQFGSAMTSLTANPETKQKTELTTQERLAQDGNTAGIPTAQFIEDPADFLQILPDTDSADSTAKLDATLNIMQSLLQRYKFMETNLAKNLNTYKEKIPTISRALDAVKHLMKCKEDSTELNVHFNLANNVYSEATVKPEGKVALWLGVNVMLEYSYEEALALLNDNFTKATDKLEETRHNYAFLREQIITTEVNIARIYNYGKRRWVVVVLLLL